MSFFNLYQIIANHPYSIPLFFSPNPLWIQTKRNNWSPSRWQWVTIIPKLEFLTATSLESPSPPAFVDFKVLLSVSANLCIHSSFMVIINGIKLLDQLLLLLLTPNRILEKAGHEVEVWSGFLHFACCIIMRWQVAVFQMLVDYIEGGVREFECLAFMVGGNGAAGRNDN